MAVAVEALSARMGSAGWSARFRSMISRRLGDMAVAGAAREASAALTDAASKAGAMSEAINEFASSVDPTFVTSDENAAASRVR